MNYLRWGKDRLAILLGQVEFWCPGGRLEVPFMRGGAWRCMFRESFWWIIVRYATPLSEIGSIASCDRSHRFIYSWGKLRGCSARNPFETCVHHFVLMKLYIKYTVHSTVLGRILPAKQFLTLFRCPLFVRTSSSYPMCILFLLLVIFLFPNPT